MALGDVGVGEVSANPVGENPEQVLAKIVRQLRMLNVAVLVLGAIISGIAIYNRVEQAKVKAALCSVRDDRQADVDQSVDFLVDHPEGAPSLGYTARDIQQRITENQRTVDSLNKIGCE